MIDHARFAALVDQRMAQVIDRERGHYGHLDPLVDGMFTEIARLLGAGGKRTRPEFAHLGWVAAGGEPYALTAVNIGAALELLHVSALVHDDVIDGADSRRGAATTHVRVAAEHHRHGWAGEERRVAEGAAVLTGNVAYAMADAALGDVNAGAREQWTRVRTEVNIGQYLDLLGSAARQFDEEHVLRVMTMKTAKYTVERPLRMGAAATGTADESLVDSLGMFGEFLGVAFQMRDDILGVFGDPSVTGKPAGDDLREGKTTFLTAFALMHADDAQRAVLSRIGSPDLTDAEILNIQMIMRECGALGRAENEVEGFRAKAFGLVGDGQVSDDVLAELVRAADRVTRRVS